jgi:N-glycosylase/DNA lyase
MRIAIDQTIVEADAIALRNGDASVAVLALAQRDPDADALVRLDVAGMRLEFSWGKPHHLGTACYWVEQARRKPGNSGYALGTSLREEVAACLLGGHGMPARVGLAAFDAVRSAGLLEDRCRPTSDDIETVLRRPLRPSGVVKPVLYRFPRQRALRLAFCLAELARENPPVEALALRDWLMRLPGIGPKTAAWIARNRTGSDDVAIIDIHLRRAGLAAGFFSPHWRLPRDYGAFELGFVAVARLGGVPTAALDAYIWDELQYLGRAGSAVLGREISAFG